MKSLSGCACANGILALLIALALSGCAGAAGTFRPAGKALEFPKFSVMLPPAPGWREISEPDGGKSAGRSLSATHTVVAVVVYSELDRSLQRFPFAPGTSPDEQAAKIARLTTAQFRILEEAVEVIRVSYSTGRHKILSFHSDLYDDGDPSSICRSYDFSVEDRGVPDLEGQSLPLIGLGLLCVHNDLNIVYRLEYSERRLPDVLQLLHFQEEAMVFLNGFRKRE